MVLEKGANPVEELDEVAVLEDGRGCNCRSGAATFTEFYKKVRLDFRLNQTKEN